jgi:2-keto-3-deoxy-L-rhamnonate aldolase RhmA
MYRAKHLKARLRAGEKSLGTWLQSAEPIFAEMAAIAGFDFIILDQKHGAGVRGLRSRALSISASASPSAYATPAGNRRSV